MVKKVLLTMLACLLLSGCGTQETFETVADAIQEPVAAEPGQVQLNLPSQASVSVLAGEDGTIYQCDGYTIGYLRLPSGNLDSTLRQISGFVTDALTMVRTDPGDYARYDLVWSCLGELGQQVGRAAVLDDGHYHYGLWVLADAQNVKDLEQTWNDLFDSYWLS